MSEFALHPRLGTDAVFVADWALSRVLLMEDSRYLWLVLVPRRAGAVEIFDLDATERGLLMDEIARAARGLKDLTGCAKINIGALGNLVPQLHVHIVARSAGDAAWPGPVWGQGHSIRYDAAQREELLARLRAKL